MKNVPGLFVCYAIILLVVYILGHQLRYGAMAEELQNVLKEWISFSLSFMAFLGALVLLRRGKREISRRLRFLFEAIDKVAERKITIVILGLSFLVYYIYGWGFPLSPGRDYGSYLTYFVDFLNPRPVMHFLMTYRTPLVPFILGGLISWGGAPLLEFGMAVFYSISILSMYQLASYWGRKVAVFSVFLILLYPSYALLFHLAASEAICAFIYIIWCAYIIRTAKNPTLAKFFIHAGIVFALILTRPSSQVFLLFAFFPFLALKTSFCKKLCYSGAFLFLSVALIFTWAFHNHVRYQDFTLSRNTNAYIPIYRLMIFDKAIRSQNGPRTRELAKVIEKKLLTVEPYRSYKITLDDFFNSNYNVRMWADLITLSDREWGWGDKYQILWDVAMEAIIANPFSYIRNTLNSYYLAFSENFYALSVPRKKDSLAPLVKMRTDNLPTPTEGQLIPRSYCSWLFSSPDNRIIPDPNTLALKLPFQEEQRYKLLQDKLSRLPIIPTRDGNQRIAEMIISLQEWYPVMGYWCFMAILITLMRIKGKFFYLSCLFPSLIVLLISYAGINPIRHYRISFDPIFILGGVLFLKSTFPKCFMRKRSLLLRS